MTPDSMTPALKAREQGKIRFIGITNHRLSVATKAAVSGLYDTIQFPFSYLSTEADEKIVKACRDNDIGFIAMKALFRRAHHRLGHGLRLSGAVR